MAEAHEHDYKVPKLFKVVVCDNVDYTGNPGDFAFITKSCKCGKVQPLDYGRTHLMQEKYEVLHRGSITDNRTTSNSNLPLESTK